MMEDYVSFAISKLLKEKGFEWECIGYYVDDEPNDIEYSFLGETNSTWESRCYSAPTLQMAMKWLRKVHNKHCDIGYDIDLGWFLQITDLKETEDDYCPKYYYPENGSGFKSYEEASKEAIKYCLENLI